MTVTLLEPVPDGDVAVIEVEELNVTEVPEVVPNLTVELLVKPVPVIVIGVPPAKGPLVGLMEVTAGVPM